MQIPCFLQNFSLELCHFTLTLDNVYLSIIVIVLGQKVGNKDFY